MRLFAHSAPRHRVTDERLAAMRLYGERQSGVRAELLTIAPRTVATVGAPDSKESDLHERHAA